jgi:hypothetical protein
MRTSALPLGEQLIIFLIGPPVMAVLWWLASRGFGTVAQGGEVSDRTKRRQRVEFWLLLLLMYLLGFGIFIYASLRRP